MKSSKYKRLLLLLTVIISTYILTGCTTLDSFKEEFFGDKTEEVVRIGIYEPMSGVDKKSAELEIQGIELAHSMYPTVDGKKVELIYEDNRSDIGGAEEIISNLIGKNPLVILGSYGNANTLAAAKSIEKAQIPAIAITNTNPVITSSYDYYFRVCYVDTYQGTALAYYAANGLKAEKVAVMVPSGDEKAAAISQKFMAKFISLTGKESSIVNNIEYQSGSSSYEDQLKEIRKSRAKVILLPASVDDAAVILRQAYDMGIDADFLGTDSWDEETLIKEAGINAASRATFMKATDIETAGSNRKAMETFLEGYNNMYGNDNVPDSAVALGYDAYVIAIKAIAKAGSDASGSEIRDAILKTRYKGASGAITFTAKGNPYKSVTIYSISVAEEKGVPVYIVEPDGKGERVK